MEDAEFRLLDEGELNINKKAVYEPSVPQRCRQLVCSRGWALTILVVMGLLLVIVAIIASFARPITCPDAAPPAFRHTSTPGNQKEQPDFVATNGEAFPWKHLRLPNSVKPLSYDIFMHPNISEQTFKGKVTIDAAVVEETDFIVFHAKNLKIPHFSVQSKRSGRKMIILTSRYLEYKKAEQFYIELKEKLKPGERIEIEVSFEAELINKLSGFYRSVYKTKSGEERALATTHFEPTDARAAFPCFDEPDLKANFTMSMVRDIGHISLFNMPLKSTEPYGENLQIDRFEQSVKMSTYLVAFVVCDYANVTKYTSGGVKVSVYAPSEQISQAQFALEGAVKVLEYYDNFFGVPYPLPKQDLIAVPDFAAGAMENWGLIVYRMTSILYDDKMTSLSRKQRVAVVVAHELAHQWFGDLVTMTWWDDLWLNEGFATYVEYIGAGVIQPDLKMDEQFILATQKALFLDSYTNSHPIHVPVHDPAQINEIFDQISYAKGGSVLKMLHYFLGADNFKRGLMAYLKKHKYGNARSNDLWEALEEVSHQQGVNVTAVMETWIRQMGYPTVMLKKDGSNLVLTQEHFLMNSDVKKDSIQKSPYDYKWYIPFTLKTSDGKEEKLIWMNMTSVTVPYPQGIKWMKGNVNVNGFYRVNYEQDMWKMISDQLFADHKVFTTQDRAGYINDAFSLVRANKLSLKTALDLTKYLLNETEYIPWSTSISNIYFIKDLIYYEDVFISYREYILKLIQPSVAALGLEDTGSTLDRYLRVIINKLAAEMGNKKVIDEGKELFKKWKQDPSSISSNLKSFIYKIGIEHGDEEDWRYCWDQYERTIIPSEKAELLNALAQTTDIRLLHQLLRYSLDEKKIKSQDSIYIIINVASTPAGQLLAWRFFKENYDILFKRYGVISFHLSGLVKGVTGSFRTEFDYNDVKSFFEKRDVGSASRAVEQSLEKIKMNIDWLKRHKPEISDWLKENAS